MKRQCVVAAVICLIFLSCGPDDSGSTGADVAESFTTLPPEIWQGLERYRARDRQQLLNCDAFLTEVESDGFCSLQTPNDWVPFEYDRRTFYMQPLANIR